MLDDKDFALAQDRLLSLALWLRKIDLTELIKRLEITKKTAPIFDPEMNEAGMNDLISILAIARAAVEFKLRLALIHADWRRRKARQILGALNG